MMNAFWTWIMDFDIFLIWLFSVSSMLLALMLLFLKVDSSITVAAAERLALFFFKSSLIYLSFLVLYTLCVYRDRCHFKKESVVLVDYGKITEFQGATSKVECNYKHHRQEVDVFFKSENGNVRLPFHVKAAVGDRVQYILTVEGGYAVYQYLVNESVSYEHSECSWWDDKNGLKHALKLLKDHHE
jgi:hypothetical protein